MRASLHPPAAASLIPEALPGWAERAGHRALPAVPQRLHFAAHRHLLPWQPTTQALVVLLIYFVIAAAALSLPGWFGSPRIPVIPDTEAEAAAMVIPVVSV